MQENKPTALWPPFKNDEVGRKVLQESGSVFSLMSPWNQKKTPWPFLCKQVNQACHHCLHGKQHIQRLQQRDMRMTRWYRQFAGKRQTWSLVSLTQREPEWNAKTSWRESAATTSVVRPRRRRTVRHCQPVGGSCVENRRLHSPTGTKGCEAGLWRDMPMLLTA